MTQLVIVSSSSLSHPRKWRGIARSWYKLAENRWQSQENTSTERRSSDRTAVSVIQSNPPPTRTPPTNGRGRSATAGTLNTPDSYNIYLWHNRPRLSCCCCWTMTQRMSVSDWVQKPNNLTMSATLLRLPFVGCEDCNIVFLTTTNQSQNGHLRVNWLLPLLGCCPREIQRER